MHGTQTLLFVGLQKCFLKGLPDQGTDRGSARACHGFKVFILLRGQHHLNTAG